MRVERGGAWSGDLLQGVMNLCQLWLRRRETLHQQPDFISPDPVLVPSNQSCLINGIQHQGGTLQQGLAIE